LRYDLSGIFVEGAGLRDGLHRFLDLRVGLQLDLEAFLLTKGGQEDLLLDLALDPVEIFTDFRLGIVDAMLAHVGTQVAHHAVIDFEVLGDGWAGAEVVAGEAADAGLEGKENIGTQQGLLKLGELGRGDVDVRGDAAAAGYLAAAVGELYLAGMVGECAHVVLLVERNAIIVGRDEGGAWRVVTGRSQRESSVFAQRSDGLHQALAERGFTHDKATVVVLHCAGNDFGGRSGVAINENHEWDVVALIAANRVVAAIGGSAAMVRNDELILVEKHIANGHGFIEKAAGIPAHVENQAVERRSVELLQRVSDFMVSSFVKPGEADIADTGFEQKRDIHGVARNFVARHGENQRLRISFTRNSNFNDGALGAFEHVGDVASGQTIGGLVVDLHDDVAGTYAGVIGRCADVGSHDHRVVLAGGDDHADAVILAALIFAQESELAGVEEIGVRVKHAEHAGNGALVDGLVDVDGLRVIGLNDIQNARKIANGGLVIVRGGRGGPHIWAVNAAQDRRYKQDCYDKENPATLWFHPTLA